MQVQAPRKAGGGGSWSIVWGTGQGAWVQGYWKALAWRAGKWCSTNRIAGTVQWERWQKGE
eukprot:12929737-Prorocentrum_lima.AAC.1